MVVDQIDPYGFNEWENNFFNSDVELNQKKIKNIVGLKNPDEF